MSNWLQNIICACCSEEKIINIDEFDKDPLGWTYDQGYHAFGDFSMAAVYGNSIMEDHSQLDVGKNAFFVGIYDGYSGNYTSTYILANLFRNLVWHIQHNDGHMSEDILRQVVAEMEESVMNDIRNAYEQCPELGLDGSSCLICILWEERLYIANLGDSRAVMGSSVIPFNRFIVRQLVRDHNACNEDIRLELMNLHPDDPNIVTYNFDAWRVKGIREVSRGIGHAYWKREPFTLNSSNQVPVSERVPYPFTRPLLSAEPEIHSRRIHKSNKFIIFGSGGLWKLLTNEEAAKIVKNNPREGIAKRLVMIALEIAAKRRNKSYTELRAIPEGHGVSRGPSVSVEGTRKEYHDDITVIVVFFDKMPNRNQTVMPPEFISFKAFTMMEPSDFRYLIGANMV